MSEVKKDSIKLEDGKVVINNSDLVHALGDQGMQFKDDGSLDLEDGQNIKATISLSIG